MNQFEQGIIPKESEIRDRILDSGEYNLKPEFLNRLDAIIPFAPLSKEDLVKILDLQLKRFVKPLQEKKISVELTPEAKAVLVDAGYSPAFGARPLKRVIDTYLGTKISEMIIAGELKPEGNLQVDAKEGELVFEAS